MRDALLQNKKWVVLAIILSLLAGGSVYWYLNRLTNQRETTVEMVSVVVAVADISKSTIIQEDMLTTTEVPKDLVQAGSLSEVSEAVGSIAGTKIFEGQQVLSKALVRQGDRGSGLSYTVPPGKRAVTVAVTQVSGLDGQLMPGDRVDVAAVLDFDGGITQTSIVLQNIEILSVGRILDADAKTWAQREQTEGTITLAVTPQEAQTLVYASERGTIRMLLRSPTDTGTSAVGALRGSDLLQGR